MTRMVAWMTTEGRAMWRDTAWSWVFIVIVVMFGLAFGG
jgi:hypothetical protein